MWEIFDANRIETLLEPLYISDKTDGWATIFKWAASRQFEVSLTIKTEDISPQWQRHEEMLMWLTWGWACGWCRVWRGRARGRRAGWAGRRSGRTASPHWAAAARWGESGCPQTGSERPEDPSPPAPRRNVQARPLWPKECNQVTTTRD